MTPSGIEPAAFRYIAVGETVKYKRFWVSFSGNPIGIQFMWQNSAVFCSFFVKVPRQKRNGQLQNNTTFRHKLTKDTKQGTKQDTNETDNKYSKEKKNKRENNLNKNIMVGK